MNDTNFYETMLNKLDHAERFYDGPIPKPVRRKIFAPRDKVTAGKPDTWRTRARESAAWLQGGAVKA